MTKTNLALLQADASNRGWRSLAQGLAIDIAVGVALVLASLIGPWGQWGDVQWAIMSFSVAKSVMQAVCAFVLRRFLEGMNGKVPMVPLPTNPPGQPDDDQPQPLDNGDDVPPPAG